MVTIYRYLNRYAFYVSSSACCSMKILVLWRRAAFAGREAYGPRDFPAAPRTGLESSDCHGYVSRG